MFPDRLVNVGIAEQNMVGVAAGLANEGFTTFATTYATFASARAAGPVRVNMGYMGLGVKLVGMASGFSVGLLGPTHEPRRHCDHAVNPQRCSDIAR